MFGIRRVRARMASRAPHASAHSARVIWLYVTWLPKAELIKRVAPASLPARFQMPRGQGSLSKCLVGPGRSLVSAADRLAG